MQREERKEDRIVGVRAAMRGKQAEMWTSLPGILQSYDSAKQTCTVQPSIMAQTLTQKGKWQDVALPLLLDVPVQFQSGGTFSMTFPLASGNEGIVIFASRCIDAWWQSGGVQRQSDLRMHDLSDGMFIPGIRSQPRKLSNISTTAAQLRTDDGMTLVELGPDYVFCRRGDANGARFVASDTVSKIKKAGQYVVVTDDNIILSKAAIIGPDPDPH